MSSKALEMIANDPVKALEMAYKGVSKVEPEKKDMNYLQAQSDAIQKLAKELLNKRKAK